MPIVIGIGAGVIFQANQSGASPHPSDDLLLEDGSLLLLEDGSSTLLLE